MISDLTLWWCPCVESSLVLLEEVFAMISAFSPRARHPGMWSQVGLRKHHYEQSNFRWWNSSWSISNPKRWCCESASLYMPTNMGNSAVATRLEKVCFHSNPKERQSQRMLKLLHNCTQTPHLRSGGCAGTGGPRGATPCSRSGGAVVRRYPSLKVRSSGCALLEQPWRDTPHPR